MLKHIEHCFKKCIRKPNTISINFCHCS